MSLPIGTLAPVIGWILQQWGICLFQQKIFVLGYSKYVVKKDKTRMTTKNEKKEQKVKESKIIQWTKKKISNNEISLLLLLL